MKTKLIALVVAFAFVFAFGSPAYAADKCKKSSGKQIAGALVGGLVGGLIGNKIDRGVGTAVGAAAGGLLGATIAKKLDKCERQKVEAATIAAANDATGKPQTWKSDTREGVHGTIVAAPPTTLADGRQCRSITRVSYIAGEEVRDEPRVCRTPPESSWQVA